MRKSIKEGTRFNRLVVLKKTENKNSEGYLYECLCDCGNIKYVNSSPLKSGNTKSCGCLNKELSNERFRKVITKHGLYNTRIRKIWQEMKTRCTNKNRNSYKNYGGRGVKICDEWFNDFLSFYSWSYKNGYDDTLSLDRINNNGDYEPSNCRWTNKITQANNTRTNKYLEYEGQKYTLAQICRKYNKDYDLVKQRLNNLKWSLEDALFKEKRIFKNKRRD